MSAPKKVKIKSTHKTNVQLPTLRPHAAGIDIGATQIQAAVPCDADSRPVRTFSTFTDDLHALRDWLKKCGVQTVAMESTSVYWIPLFQILEAAGLEVCLVNARHCKNLPGRKTDISDCQWIQYLHSVGLLRASFRPPEQICAVRSLLRHRANLIRYAGSHVQHLQKALTQMNLQIHNVISDLTGVTGLAILDAILAGERDPQKLAALKDHRIKASRDTIARSLHGDWRPEHLFVIQQALDTWRHYQKLIAQCDQQIQQLLARFDSQLDLSQRPLTTTRLQHKKPQRDGPNSMPAGTLPALRRGLDPSARPSSQHRPGSLHRTGTGFCHALSTAKCFGSWLGLCPDDRITGGKIISVKTRDMKSRAAQAVSAGRPESLARQKLCWDVSAAGSPLGTPKAITAMAHQLARISGT